MNNKTSSWPAILVAIASFLAVLPWPYSYYQILRIAVCGISIYYLYWAYAKGAKLPAKWLAIGFAILFNPIAPITLDRSIWAFFNIACGIYFLILFVVIKKYGENPKI